MLEKLAIIAGKAVFLSVSGDFDEILDFVWKKAHFLTV